MGHGAADRAHRGHAARVDQGVEQLPGWLVERGSVAAPLPLTGRPTQPFADSRSTGATRSGVRVASVISTAPRGASGLSPRSPAVP